MTMSLMRLFCRRQFSRISSTQYSRPGSHIIFGKRRHSDSSRRRPTFRWLDLNGSGLSILERLVLEECLLRHDSKYNWLIAGAHSAHPHRHLNQVATPDYFVKSGGRSQNPDTAVVLGIGGKTQELLNTDLVEEEGCICIRRFSGGGTVVVDPDSIWTTIIGRTEQLQHVDPYPRSIMKWTAKTMFAQCFQILQNRQEEKQQNSASSSTRKTMVLDIKSCGAAAGNTGKLIEIEHQGGSPDSIVEKRKVNEFSLREHDYVLGEGKKMGGNAQAIVKGGWLHHTSFLWDYVDENMAYLKLPKNRPDYRLDRSHQEFLVKLRDAFPSLRKSDFTEALLEACRESNAVERVTYNDAVSLVFERTGAAGWQELYEKYGRSKVLEEL